jgi:redox-regulated HSP33 family molecular chaperone
MDLNMDKEPETAEEALYQGLVMQMLPDQTKTEREELDDIVSNLTAMLPVNTVNFLKFKAMLKFLGIGDSDVS